MTAATHDNSDAIILIVDDTPENLKLLADTLSENGFRTRAARSGPVAIRAAHAEAPDLILLDVGMPQMDGFEVCAVLKADPGLKDVPVIFISAMDETMDKVRAFSVGAVDYVTKPFEFEEVLARVRTHLRLSGALEAEREMAALRSRFISMASHEFRTPLTTILSSAELLERYGDTWPAEKRLAHLKRIESSAMGMTELLDDVLVLGRAAAGKIAFTPAETDVGVLCNEIVDDMRLSDRDDHELVLRVSAKPAVAFVDERLIRRILENLLSNAMKYSESGTEVHLDASFDGTTAQFVVADEGIGVPDEDAAHIFEAFHRGRNAAAKPGTGLGLTVVSEAVELHGGSIALQSGPDAGTTVTVTLPAQPTLLEGGV